MTAHKRIMCLFVLIVLSAGLTGSHPASAQQAVPIPWPTHYTHIATIPAVGDPSGQYTGEFSSGDAANVAVDPSKLPNRPFIGTELYYENGGEAGAQQREWFKEIGFDFLRVEVDAAEIIGKNRKDSLLPSTFTDWGLDEFENGKLWRFNDPDTSVTNILENSYSVSFPYMMIMHYGAESFMGQVPDSANYADYFLATVYYYNVVRGMNIKYWEVLNEPDWGYGDKTLVVATPAQYAAIFKRVAERIKNFPDPRVNSIALGGPALGSGDPTDGTWPDGYQNRTRDGERKLQEYIPTLLAQGSRSGQRDVGFLSWHIYGSETWGRPNNIYELNQNYAIINQIENYYKLGTGYTGDGAGLPLVISEMNFAAGDTKAEAKAYYKNFYAALWHTSTLNDVFSTGRIALLSDYRWKGDNHWPKGLVYQDKLDSGNQLVRNPVWWAYREYLQHTQTKILSAYNSKRDPWADALVTTDDKGQILYLIAVNKSDQPKTLDFSFDVPASINGQVAISRRTMEKSGDGAFGAPFAEPTITDAYQFQRVTLAVGKQLHYHEVLPPRTIVYYTVVKAS